MSPSPYGHYNFSPGRQQDQQVSNASSQFCSPFDARSTNLKSLDSCVSQARPLPSQCKEKAYEFQSDISTDSPFSGSSFEGFPGTSNFSQGARIGINPAGNTFTTGNSNTMAPPLASVACGDIDPFSLQHVSSLEECQASPPEEEDKVSKTHRIVTIVLNFRTYTKM